MLTIFNPSTTNDTLNIETKQLICSANQFTGFDISGMRDPKKLTRDVFRTPPNTCDASFCKNSQELKDVNYLCKTFYHRCLTLS